MIDIVIEIDQYFFSFEPGLVSTSGPGPGQRCNGYLKVHKRNGFEEQNIEYKVLLIMIKGVQQMMKRKRRVSINPYGGVPKKLKKKIKTFAISG